MQRYEPLWQTATEALSATVAELTARYGGGTPFFDALDERMRDPLYFDALMSKVIEEYPDATHIVVSGKFGEAFAPWLAHSWWSFTYPPALVVPGNLRHTELPPFHGRIGERFSNAVFAAGVYLPPTEGVSTHRFVFVDDSVYKFRTYNQIKQRIEEAGADMVGHVVLYDGSREPKRIPSFYRWHPNGGIPDA